METLASFGSRSEAVKLFNVLKNKRIAAYMINTPSSLRAGCGLSVVFPSHNRLEVNMLIWQLGFVSFMGFFVK
ncbi:MAG TPA: DUF3343 domain-containing protein [Clostridia bacterium]|nr:DUF3343 domain-containing protein [Clostridia bacterium]